MKEITKKIRTSVAFIESHTDLRPEIAIILGTGLNDIGKMVEPFCSLDYKFIPQFLHPSVEGHRGELIIGTIDQIPCIVLSGRVHQYEGYSAHEVAYPVRVLAALGVKQLILTNASRGIHPRYRSGTLMLIADHINLTGTHPLVGPNNPEFGPRFLDLGEPYSKRLLDLMRRSAEEEGIAVSVGVYAATLGPCYETLAEIKMLRMLGVEAVGMSTVPECIVAQHHGIEVAGISYIAASPVDLYPEKLSHSDILENVSQGSSKIEALISKMLPHVSNKMPLSKK